MAKIPRILHDAIATAFPMNVCLVATVLANGFAQVTPRGSLVVLDNEHLGFWERGKGSTNADLRDGAKVTVYFRSPELRATGVLPRGGIARFYGTATIHRSGPRFEEVWRRMIEQERNADRNKAGFAVVVDVERAEDLGGNPLPETLPPPAAT